MMDFRGTGTRDLLAKDGEGNPMATCLRLGVHPELFFPSMTTNGSTVRVDVRAAAACAHCPLRRRCNEQAKTNRHYGFWGGQAFDGTKASPRAHVVVDPDGVVVELDELLATDPSGWVETFYGRRSYIIKGRPRKKLAERQA